MVLRSDVSGEASNLQGDLQSNAHHHLAARGAWRKMGFIGGGSGAWCG
jgi:hypothetical protein